MIVSVDVGYGYTKAVSNDGRVVFPSVVSPAPEEVDIGIDTRKIGYTVTLRAPSSTVKEHFCVGELALRNARTANITLAHDKFVRDSSLKLTFAAAYLLGAEGRIALGLGTPIAYYRHQKNDILKALSGIQRYVCVNGGPEKLICFDQVFVFPQGVGALMSIPDLPTQGMIGLIDIGFYTTDHILVDLKDGEISVYPDYVGSVEMGISTAMREFANRFAQKTGYPLKLSDVIAMWDRDTVKLYGKPVDITPLKKTALEVLATNIADAVDAAWKEKIAGLDVLYVAGGGGMQLFQLLNTRLEADIRLARDAQFANALGFFSMVQRQLAVREEQQRIEEKAAEDVGLFR
jgi:plasmid segregation protein ParM